MNIGDLVTRQSYDHDIPFIIEAIVGDTVFLSGLHHRLFADAKQSDLVLASFGGNETDPTLMETPNIMGEVSFTSTKGFLSNVFELFHTNNNPYQKKAIWTPNANEEPICHTKILHIDGNKRYLKECMADYKKYHLPVIGYSIPEELQPQNILALLEEYQPNILVITGHDAIKKTDPIPKNLDSYLNSRYFAESVKIARNYNADKNDLVIIAGGCKSHSEALLDAGANFASSPGRILINVTEPVTLACMVATTPSQSSVTMEMVKKGLPSGILGFGGIETRGQCHLLS